MGALAFALSNCTCNCCSAAAAAAIDGAIGAGAWSTVPLAIVLARGVGVAKPESVPRGSVDVVLSGVGSMTFVRLGRGDEGSDGGSWAGRGVSDIVCCVCWRLERGRGVVARFGGGAVKEDALCKAPSLAGWRGCHVGPFGYGEEEAHGGGTSMGHGGEVALLVGCKRP